MAKHKAICEDPGRTEFITQKLDDMHHSPGKGKWNLVDDFALYPHSSAGFYYGINAHIYKQLAHAEVVNIQRTPGVSPQG